MCVFVLEMLHNFERKFSLLQRHLVLTNGASFCIGKQNRAGMCSKFFIQNRANLICHCWCKTVAAKRPPRIFGSNFGPNLKKVGHPWPAVKPGQTVLLWFNSTSDRIYVVLIDGRNKFELQYKELIWLPNWIRQIIWL